MVNPEMSCWYGESCVCAFFFGWCALRVPWNVKLPKSLNRRNFVFRFNLPNKCKNYPEIKERTVNRPRRKVDPKLWPLHRTFNGSEFLLERQGFPFQRLSKHRGLGPTETSVDKLLAAGNTSWLPARCFLRSTSNEYKQRSRVVARSPVPRQPGMD